MADLSEATLDESPVVLGKLLEDASWAEGFPDVLGRLL